MSVSLTGKTCVVVGGSRGIGAEFVRQLAAKGNRVIAGCRCAAGGMPWTGSAAHRAGVHALLAPPPPSAGRSAAVHTCRQPSQAKEIAGVAGVQLTTVDVSSPQSVEAWAAEVQALAPHLDLVIK